MNDRPAPRSAKPFRPLLGSIAALLALSALAQAGQVWDGGGANGLWSTSLNWDADTAPNFGLPLQFGGVLQLASSNDATASAAGLTFNAGAGAFTLSGKALTLTGGITNSSGSLQTVSFTALTLGAPQTFNADTAALSVTTDVSFGASTLTIDGANNTTLGGALTGTGGLVKNGAGTLLLSGASTYTGQTAIGGGTLKAGSLTALAPMSPLFVVGGKLDLGGFSNTVGSLGGVAAGFVENIGGTPATLTVGGNDTSTEFQGVIRDGLGGSALSLVKTGTGAQTLSGGNSYTGGTTLENGALVVNNNGAFGTGTLTITSAGGATELSTENVSTTLTNAISVQSDFSMAAPGDFRLNGPVDLNAATRVVTGLTHQSQIHFGGVISNGSLTLATSGLPAQVPGVEPYVAFIFDGATGHTYTGLTTVDSGAILVFQSTAEKLTGDVLVQGTGVVDYLGFSDQISDTSTVTVNSPGSTITGPTHFAGLELRNLNDTIGALFGSSAGTVGLGSGVLTVGAGNFSGVVGDGGFGTGGQLTKNTAGTLTLGGANTYTGDTNVTAGRLEVVGSVASATINVNGGTFIAGKSGAVVAGAAVKVAAGAGFEYHAVADAPLTIGSLTLSAGAGKTIGGSIGTTTGGAAIHVTGNVNPGAGAIKVNVFSVTGTAAPGSYTLLTGGAGSTLNAGGVSYSLGTVFNATNFTVSAPVATPTTLSVTVAAAAPLASAYWVGGLSGSPSVWAASNWATNPAGTATPLVPSAGTNVFFSSTAAPTDPGNMSLGASMSIASLTVNGAGAPETRTFTLNNDGNHTLTLAGAGGIAINAGAGAVTLKPNLILGASQAWTNNSANLFTAGGNVSNGGNDLTIAGSGDALLTGVIGNGAGGLVKNGAGKLTVTQDHTYTGDTFLNEGSLFVENPTTGGTIRPFGFGTLHIAGGTTLGITVPNVIIPNPVQVTGDFTIVTSVSGQKDLVLSGAIDLQGGTRMITGTTSNGLIVIPAAISNGGLTLTNAAPLGLTNIQFGSIAGPDASNTYAGLTTVNSGVALQLRKALAGGAIDGAIKGDVLVNAGGSIAYGASNQIADTSSVTLHGTGIIDSGGNKVAALELGNGTVAGGQTDTIGALLGDGTVGLGFGLLTVGRGNFSGAIGDGAFGAGGQLTKNTTGTLILSGVNTFTGNTNINNGTLVLNGSVQSPVVFVNFAGTLMGTGTAAHNVINAGVLSPGNSAGTFRIGESYFQSAAGTLVIEIAGSKSSQHDLVTVGGQAQLDGSLRLVKLGKARLKVGDKVTFLTAAGGVTGQFAKVDNAFTTDTIVRANVVYGTNDVALEMVQGSFAALATVMKLTPNQKIIGGALDHVVADASEKKLIDFLNSEPLANLPHDYDLIAAEELQAAYSIGYAQANVQTANIQRRMDDIRSGVHGFSAEGLSVTGTGEQAHAVADPAAPLAGLNGPTGTGGKELRAPAPAGPVDRRFGYFITGVGEFSRVGDSTNARGYDLATGGFTLGVDYRLTPNITVGLNTGYARSGADLAGGGRLTVDGAKLGAYATYFDEGFYVDAAVQGGYNSYSTRRTALKGTATGSPSGGEVNALIATGFDFTSDALRIGPTASFQYTHIGIGSFQESGSLAPLRFPSQGGDSTRVALGMKAAYEFRMSSGVVVRPEARVSWQHECGDIAYAIDARFANGGGGTFTVQGSEIGRDSALLGLGVAVLWNERTAAYLFYDGEVGRSNYTSNNVSGGMRMTF